MNYVELDVSTKNHPGFKCKVDVDDLPRLNGMRWAVTLMGERGYKLPYVRTRIGGKRDARYIRLHRLIMNAPDGVEVDHINGDTLDNRKSNLRLATRLEQSRNTGMRRNNTTGYKGVSLIKSSGLYRAYIVVDRRQIHLGVYEDPALASEAYETAAESLFGEFVRRKNGEVTQKSRA